jgi:hypothetical protein
MPSKPLTRLLPIIATLALALATPVALARPHHSACASHAGTRAVHATRTCANTPTATKPKARHKGGAHHGKHTSKHGRAQAPHHTTEAQVASCEDGSTPLITSGEAACADGSEPSCENGSEPLAGASGALTCPVAETDQQGGEGICEAEACTFDSEGAGSPEEG